MIKGIPPCKKIDSALKALEDAVQGLIRTKSDPELEKSIIEDHENMSSEKLKACECELCTYYDAIKRLVGLCHVQLYHPYVEAALSFPRQWNYLRSFRLGLETGIKTPLGTVKANWITGEGETLIENTFEVLNALIDGRIPDPQDKKHPVKRKSYTIIQRSLEARGLIEKGMSRQNFHERAQTLMRFAEGSSGPFFNESARPSLPKQLPTNIEEAWARANEMLRNERWTDEKAKELEEYIKQRQSELLEHFQKKLQS